MSIGDLKSLLLFWENLAKNHRYRPYLTERDFQTFRRRGEHEGFTFLTTALPSIGRALDSFHATTAWECPPDFSSEEVTISRSFDGNTVIVNRYRDHEKSPEIEISCETSITRIPHFLGYAIDCALSGDSLAVDCVRQLTYVFYKLEVTHDKSKEAEFLVNFKRVDESLACTFTADDTESSALILHMRGIISRILCNTDPLDIRPCHGGGATACHTPNWEKWHKLKYYPKLDAIFSYSDYFFLSYTHLADEMGLLENSQDMCVPRARVVLVPKDSRGPRVISCEPAEMMFIQQGLMRKLYEIVESHPLSRGQINFTDQSINNSLAKLASEKNHLATIDLTDASDRVSLSLVRQVFPENWVKCLEACRSEETTLPDGSVVKLNKFAPMGSSCCFPVEALVFWASAQAAIHMNQVRMMNREGLNLTAISTCPVYVYGDDIITPSNYAGVVVRGLERIGLAVSPNKTFVDGPFRESCGGDYHKGYDVTPVRMRKIPSIQGTGVCTTADLANSLVAKFGYTDALLNVQLLEQTLGYVFPRTELPLPGTIRISPRASNDVFFCRRYNKNLQRYEHRVLSLASKVLTKQSPDWGEVLRKDLQVKALADEPDSYSHWSVPVDARLKPGQYADTHSARQKWGWVWLG